MANRFVVEFSMKMQHFIEAWDKTFLKGGKAFKVLLIPSISHFHHVINLIVIFVKYQHKLLKSGST